MMNHYSPTQVPLPPPVFTSSGFDLPRILTNHHQVLLQTVQLQLQENQKAEHIQLSSLLEQHASKWQELLHQSLQSFQQNVMLQMNEYKKVLTDHFQVQYRQLEQQFNDVQRLMFDCSNKTSKLVIEAEQNAVYMQHFSNLLQNNLVINDNHYDMQNTKQRNSVFATPQFDYPPNFRASTPNKITPDLKQSESAPIDDKCLPLNSYSSTSMSTVYSTASEMPSKTIESSTSVLNELNKKTDEPSPASMQPKKMSKSARKKAKKKQKKSQAVSMSEKQLTSTYRASQSVVEEDSSSTSTNVPAVVIASGSSGIKTKKITSEFDFFHDSKIDLNESSATTPSSELEIQTPHIHSSEMGSNGKLINSDALSNVLDGAKLHINVFYYKIQMLTDNFQSVSQLMAYLEQSSNFSLNDCWVEKKIG